LFIKRVGRRKLEIEKEIKEIKHNIYENFSVSFENLQNLVDFQEIYNKILSKYRRKDVFVIYTVFGYESPGHKSNFSFRIIFIRIFFVFKIHLKNIAFASSGILFYIFIFSKFVLIDSNHMLWSSNLNIFI